MMIDRSGAMSGNRNIEEGIQSVLGSGFFGVPQGIGSPIRGMAHGGRVDDGRPPYQDVAEGLGELGRFGDNRMLHVNDEELDAMREMGGITINPHTGQPEAFIGALIMGILKALMAVIPGVAATAAPAAAAAAPAAAAAIPAAAAAIPAAATAIPAAATALAPALTSATAIPAGSALAGSSGVLWGPAGGTILGGAGPGLAGGAAPGIISAVPEAVTASLPEGLGGAISGTEAIAPYVGPEAAGLAPEVIGQEVAGLVPEVVGQEAAGLAPEVISPEVQAFNTSIGEVPSDLISPDFLEQAVNPEYAELGRATELGNFATDFQVPTDIPGAVEPTPVPGPNSLSSKIPLDGKIPPTETPPGLLEKWGPDIAKYGIGSLLIKDLFSEDTVDEQDPGYGSFVDPDTGEIIPSSWADRPFASFPDASYFEEGGPGYLGEEYDFYEEELRRRGIV